MITPQKQWSMGLINGFLDNNTTKSIFNTSSMVSVINDVSTWKLEKDGAYTSRSAYKNIKNHYLAA